MASFVQTNLMGDAMKRILGAALVAATFLTPAMAADLIIEPVDEVAMAHLHDWSGMYAGVHVGYISGTTDAPWGAVGGPLTTSDDGPFDLTGWLAGGHLGVNFQSGSLVGGVEILADYAPFAGDDAGVGGDVNGLEGRFLGTLAGRVGFAADEFLFYLSGGGAVLAANGTAPLDGDVGVTFFGWTVGAGAEFAVTEDVSLRADYRYYSFGQEVASFPTDTYDMGFNPSFHTVSVGVSMAF